MTVDHISNGRLILSIGTGLPGTVEFPMVGLPDYPASERVKRFREAIEINKQEIFSKVKIMIFVMDASNLGTFTLSRQYLMRSLRNVYQYSDNPRICLFAHKMDLISQENRAAAMRVFREYLDLDKFENIEVFETSIFDNSTIDAFKTIL